MGHLRGTDRDMEWKDADELEDEDDGDEDDESEMDLDDADDMLEDLPSPSSSVATYPNTVPFQHAPRLPHLSPSQPYVEIPARRTTSFSYNDRPRQMSQRGSFSSSIDQQRTLSTSHPIHSAQYITSIRNSRAPHFPGSPDTAIASASSVVSSSGSIKRKRKSARRNDEPRLLISNNDQTVKMFSIRRSETESQSESGATPAYVPPAYVPPAAESTDRVRELQRELRTAQEHQEDVRRLYERVIATRPTAPVPAPAFGSSFGWDSIGMNEGVQAGDDALRRELERAREHLRTQQETFRREREDFERVIGMRVAVEQNQAEESANRDAEQRRLAKVGGSRFKYAINHCKFIG